MKEQFVIKITAGTLKTPSTGIEIPNHPLTSIVAIFLERFTYAGAVCEPLPVYTTNIADAEKYNTYVEAADAIKQLFKRENENVRPHLYCQVEKYFVDDVQEEGKTNTSNRTTNLQSEPTGDTYPVTHD